MRVDFEGSVQLDSRFVLLSASFPYGQRATRFPPANPAEVSDAVVAIARAVMAANGRLVFGGHPTISPLVLMVAGEYGANGQPERVSIYQSRLFGPSITNETLALERLGHGRIRWIDALPGESISAGLENLGSLERMRRTMLEETQPAAAFFVGGMEGIREEYDLAREIVPAAALFPLAAPGGASAVLPIGRELPAHLRRSLRQSRLFPALVHEALRLAVDRMG